MNAPCPLRPGRLPHYYGPRSECLYCGNVMEQEDAQLNCQSDFEKATIEERRFGDRLFLLMIIAIVVTFFVLAVGCKDVAS